MSKVRWGVVVAATLLLCGGATARRSQYQKVDFNEFLHETQKLSDAMDEVDMVWWIPPEYWRIVFADDPTITERGIEDIVRVASPYTVLVVVRGELGPFGGVTYEPEAKIRQSLRLGDGKGFRYSPLDEDSIDSDARSMAQVLKPALADMLGPMGQNMHMFFFPARDRRGQSICTATNEGSFFVELGGRTYEWRLPLGSLLPRKTCPLCKEKLNGAYKFCPWDGRKLPEVTT